MLPEFKGEFTREDLLLALHYENQYDLSDMAFRLVEREKQLEEALNGLSNFPKKHGSS